MREPFTDHSGEDFQQEMLDQVNAYRAQHGAPPLTLDPDLVAYAKSRAAHMSALGKLSHDGLQTGYGENGSWQAASEGPEPGTAAGATEAWYSEIKDFDFAHPEGPHAGVTGHFTALVWKSTTKVGFGRAVGQGAEWWETFIVANFAPPANMRGAYGANVSPKHA